MAEIDKEQLYGENTRHSRWRDRLACKASHKALDIPEDEVIQANRIDRRRGFGPLAVAGVAGVAGVPAILLALVTLLRQPSAPEFTRPTSEPKPPAVAPDTAYDAVYEEQQADGTWKEVKRERLK